MTKTQLLSIQIMIKHVYGVYHSRGYNSPIYNSWHWFDFYRKYLTLEKPLWTGHGTDEGIYVDEDLLEKLGHVNQLSY